MVKIPDFSEFLSTTPEENVLYEINEELSKVIADDLGAKIAGSSQAITIWWLRRYHQWLVEQLVQVPDHQD